MDDTIQTNVDNVYWREWQKIRHLAKRYKQTANGGDSKLEGGIGTVRTDDQQQPTTNKCASENKPTESITTSEYMGMCNNVRKAITQIQEKIQMERERLTMQPGNNLGAQINQTMLNMLINQMQVADV